MIGSVKRLTKDRGFGFIQGEDGHDYFFHRSELRGGLDFDDVKEGQRVSFEPRQGDKGPRAAEVRPG
jgi:cold shock protein